VSVAVESLRPGDPCLVGPHRLLGRLGQGGMGTVFLAVTPDDRVVAVKVLRDGCVDAEGRRRFRRELEVLQRVRGPHLVEVLGGDASAVTPWIVTRFVPGQRLDELVAESGPLPELGLVRLGLGVALALRALHAAGVVHRDLTPGNVLVLSGEAHVIDLGLAVVADLTAVTRSGMVLGTAGYLAPEQVLGEPCDSSVDVHAWGATLALAGTGRPPYGTGRPEAVLYRVVHAPPDLLGLAGPLAALVAASLAKDAAQRPSVNDIVLALEALGSRELVSVSSGPQVLRTGNVPAAEVGVPGCLAPAVPSTEVLHAGVTGVLGQDSTQVLGLTGARSLDRPSTASASTTASLSTTASASTTAARSGTAASAVTAAAAAMPVVPALSVFSAGAPTTAALTAPGLTSRYPETPRREPPVTRPSSYGPAAPVVPSALPAAGLTREPSGDGRPPVLLQRLVVGVPALLFIASAGLLAPVVTGAALALVAVLLQTSSRATAHRRLLVERRGPRRRDPVVGLLGLPARMVGAVVDVVLTVPLVVVAAAVPAYVTVNLVHGGAGPAAAASVALVIAAVVTVTRRRFASTRQGLGRTATALAPRLGDALVIGLGLLAAAALLLAAPGPIWWPVTSSTPSCVPLLFCT